MAGAGQRRRRLLPAAAVMIFVLGCVLFGGDSYGEVARKTAGWLGPLAGPGGWRVPGSAALARARRRLGPRPFELLFERLRSPLADSSTPGAAAFGKTLMLLSLDGTMLDVPATGAAIAVYGPPPGPGNSAGCAGGYPQLRLVTLIGCGTRGLADAAFGPRATSEQELTKTIAARGIPGPGMLVIADRNFCGYPVVSALAATRADLLIRARADQVLPVLHALPDGSYLSALPDPAAAQRRHKRNSARRTRGSMLPPDPVTTEGIPIRVIEADVTATPAGGQPRTEHYRLITTITDPVLAPALEVAGLYAQRRESETAFRELKTYLRGRPVMRSRDPAGVEQETWALLCACQLIHAHRAAAASHAGLDPDRISCTITLRALRRHITAGPAERARAATRADILSQLLPARRQRSYPRATQSGTATRRNARNLTAHITYTTTISPLHHPTADPGP